LSLDPEYDRKLRTNFIRRILVRLYDLTKTGEVDRIGSAGGVRSKLAKTGS